MRTRVVGRVGAAVLAAALLLTGAQLAAAQQPPPEPPGTQPPGATPPPGGAPAPGTMPSPLTPPSVAPGGQGADLSVSMTGEQDCEDVDEGDCEEHGVHVREHVNYRLKVHIRNDGPGVATNVRAQIRTPEEFEVERVSPDVCDHSRYCEIGTLAAGQDAVITLRGEYADPAEANNWVFVTSDVLDPDHDNNEARQQGEVDEPENNGAGGGDGGCFGREPTIRGTEGPDLLDGTPDDDVIVTFGGPDFIDADNGGADRICSGAGDDAVFVADGEGDDFIDCGPGEDGFTADEGDVVVNCENDFSRN